MWRWICRVLGLRYYVVYSFPSKECQGKTVIGRSGPYLKRSAEHLAAYSNVHFTGTHWVEEG